MQVQVVWSGCGLQGIALKNAASLQWRSKQSQLFDERNWSCCGCHSADKQIRPRRAAQHCHEEEGRLTSNLYWENGPALPTCHKNLKWLLERLILTEASVEVSFIVFVHLTPDLTWLCLFFQGTRGPHARLQSAAGILLDPLPHHRGNLPHPHCCFHGRFKFKHLHINSKQGFK